MMRIPLLLLPLLLLSSAVHALDFDGALQVGSQAPLVQGARNALEVRTRQDRNLPNQTGNPEVMLSPGIGLAPGVAPAWQVSAQQSWNLADLAQARSHAATQERAVLTVQTRVVALEQRLAVAQAWLQLWTDQSLLQAATRERQLAAEFGQTIARAAARGVLTNADLAEAEVFLGEAELRVVAQEGDAHEQAVVLARTLALPAEPLPEATGALPQPKLPDAATWRATIARAAKLPEVTARRLHAQAERARQVEVAALHGSSLALGGMVQRDGAGTTALFATVGVRWALFERGQRLQGQAAESVTQADAAAAQAATDAGHRLALAWHEVEHSREREQVLATRVLAAAERLLALRERQFSRGVTTVIDVLRARRERLEAERRRIEATGQRTWAELKAWILYAELQQEAE